MEPGSENPGYVIVKVDAGYLCFASMEPGSENPGYLPQMVQITPATPASMEPGSENPGYMACPATTTRTVWLQWSRGPKTPDTGR